MSVNFKIIESNLRAVLAEIQAQPEIGGVFPAELQSYTDQVQQIAEFIEQAGEYGVAYESLICMLERFPFTLSGPVAIKLLEVGLLMRFKTELPDDAQFDYR